MESATTAMLLLLAVVLSRFVQGQFDLFWVSVQVSLPFVIAGICLGALARAESESDAGPPGLTAELASPAGAR